MKKTSMTVTEASRNFADCVNRSHYQNVTFVLLKNGEPVARFVPDNEKVCVGRDLAEALAKTDLPQKEARAWHLGNCPQEPHGAGRQMAIIPDADMVIRGEKDLQIRNCRFAACVPSGLAAAIVCRNRFDFDRR